MKAVKIILILLAFNFAVSAQEKVPQSLVDSAFKEIFSDTAESFYINEFEGFSYYYGSFTDNIKTECLIIGNEYPHTTTYGYRYGRVAYFLRTDETWVYQNEIPKYFKIIKLLDINNDEVSEILAYEIFYQSASSEETYTIYSLYGHKIVPVFEWSCFDYKNSMRKGEIGDTLSRTCAYSFLDEYTLSLSFQYEIVRTVNHDFSFDIEFEDNYTFSSAEETIVVDLFRLYAIAQKKSRLTIPH